MKKRLFKHLVMFGSPFFFLALGLFLLRLISQWLSVDADLSGVIFVYLLLSGALSGFPLGFIAPHGWFRAVCKNACLFFVLYTLLLMGCAPRLLLPASLLLPPGLFFLSALFFAFWGAGFSLASARMKNEASAAN